MGEETELYRGLGRVEGKLDHLIEMYRASEIRFIKMHKEAEIRIDAYQKRLERLEAFRNQLIGIAAAVGAAAAYLLQLVTSHK